MALKPGHFKKVDQKYLGTFEMWCWRRMAKISWTDRVKNVGVLRRLKEECNILQTVTWGMANCVSHMQRRNCVLQHLIEGKIGGTRGRGRRHKKLLHDFKETRR
jgi:hypothetical protein